MNESIALRPLDSFVGTFQSWWNRQGEWVEEPNARRAGESGVQRLSAFSVPLYSKRQTGHLYHSLRYPLGRPTVLREQDAFEAIGRLGVRLPKIVFCSARKTAGKWQALLVTESLEGFVSLDAWYQGDARQRWGDAVHRQMLEQLALTLSRLHRGRWEHGCCYPKHIFVKVEECNGQPQVEIALIDLEKSRRRLRVATASRRDVDQLRRHSPAISPAEWAFFKAAYDQAMAAG
ncbi:Lipopolysaccharide kinase [Azotobacter vinelandii CA]|uniref:Lipopolysaccharide kinase n=2 Tax=Azotobacter vinelandii TaxID=354 RepID=C1DDL9_AZOVD|nr:lipopolysaccharide kinase InaA family protein [Azotobacter vinelandii]ACO77990.1 Lipopolysaccharide kinase [Azotobacter vinelandii DJ]AGK16902.1 Lipopolysaccharide kinase [Azotobacter vinelandii CA]AGK20151.1 Lipopolysaccharide kinase [Azotobacter vinelandii CA6]WKN23715.1 InaA protein [Azotobacter vinelandii]SFX91912.1 Lipopolysaccharide kinase (Kdo/WaaP) family protein [Azotobacter vinelandii]